MLDDYISTLWAKAVDTPFPPIPRRRCGDATVYVECRRGRYWLICEERGEEYWRREATDMDDAAFQLISIVAGELVRDRELEFRENTARCFSGSNDDSRWNWMYEIELMSAIKDSYGTQTTVNYLDVLRQCPLS